MNFTNNNTINSYLNEMEKVYDLVKTHSFNFIRNYNNSLLIKFQAIEFNAKRMQIDLNN